MLMGEYLHIMDEKGRVNIPSRLREELGDNFVVTRGLDNCLFIYPSNEWTALEKKLKSLSSSRAEARAFLRLFFSGAAEVELDRQGRALIPPPLREHASLQKEVIFIGVSNRAELWSKDKWEEYSREAGKSFEEVAEKMEDFPF
ncbi:MAG: division/cell wall cluster transcriptional repressor MraZ [Bacillota bacterium]